MQAITEAHLPGTPSRLFRVSTFPDEAKGLPSRHRRAFGQDYQQTLRLASICLNSKAETLRSIRKSLQPFDGKCTEIFVLVLKQTANVISLQLFANPGRLGFGDERQKAGDGLG